MKTNINEVICGFKSLFFRKDTGHLFQSLSSGSQHIDIANSNLLFKNL